ncbi:MAG: hypothetical protein AB7T06_29870 [Kofleriaceae bacterium]
MHANATAPAAAIDALIATVPTGAVLAIVAVIVATLPAIVAALLPIVAVTTTMAISKSDSAGQRESREGHDDDSLHAPSSSIRRAGSCLPYFKTLQWLGAADSAGCERPFLRLWQGVLCCEVLRA